MSVTSSPEPSSAAEVEPAQPNPLAETVRSCIAPFVVMGAILLIGLFLYSHLSRLFFIAEIICNFRGQIVALLVPFPFLLWIVKQHRWAIVSAVFLAIGAAGMLPVYLPGTQPSPGSQSVKILSFNVFGVNEQYDEVKAIVRNEDPDVMVIIEYSGQWPRVFSQFNEDFPHQVLQPRWHGYGIAVFSKLPLSGTEIHQLTGDVTDVPAIITRVKVGDQYIRLGAFHVFSPTNKFRLKMRNDQLAEIPRLFTNEEPTVIIGDFNAAPWSPVVRDLIKETNTRDSRQGFGHHATWPAFFIPGLVPIDHCFVTKDVCVHSRHIGPNAGSDHFSLVCEVSVSESFE